MDIKFEQLAQIQMTLLNMHKAPEHETGAWWRGECADGCGACQIQEILGLKKTQ